MKSPFLIAPLLLSVVIAVFAVFPGEARANLGYVDPTCGKPSQGSDFMDDYGDCWCDSAFAVKLYVNGNSTTQSSPATFTAPASYQVYWLTNASSGTPLPSCTSSFWSGSQPTPHYGFAYYYSQPANSYTYNISCTYNPTGNEVLTSSDTAYVTVNSGGSSVTATLLADPSTITQGDSSNLFWSSTGAVYCGSSNFSTGGATSNPSGGVSVSPSTTKTYSITCYNTYGTQWATSQATVTVVQPPPVSISASPTLVTSGSSSTITWSSNGATSCSVSGPGLSSTQTSGTQAVTVTNQSTYDISCSIGGQPVTSSVIVNVVPAFKEF